MCRGGRTKRAFFRSSVLNFLPPPGAAALSRFLELLRLTGEDRRVSPAECACAGFRRAHALRRNYGEEQRQGGDVPQNISESFRGGGSRSGVHRAVAIRPLYTCRGRGRCRTDRRDSRADLVRHVRPGGQLCGLRLCEGRQVYPRGGHEGSSAEQGRVVLQEPRRAAMGVFARQADHAPPPGGQARGRQV